MWTPRLFITSTFSWTSLVAQMVKHLSTMWLRPRADSYPGCSAFLGSWGLSDGGGTAQAGFCETSPFVSAEQRSGSSLTDSCAPVTRPLRVTPALHPDGGFAAAAMLPSGFSVAFACVILFAP